MVVVARSFPPGSSAHASAASSSSVTVATMPGVPRPGAAAMMLSIGATACSTWRRTRSALCAARRRPSPIISRHIGRTAFDLGIRATCNRSAPPVIAAPNSAWSAAAMSDLDAERTRQLWISVIALAVDDATADLVITSEPTPRAKRRDQARRWLTTMSADFAEVCHLAGLDPSAVSEGARRTIEQNDLRRPAPRRSSIPQRVPGQKATASGRGRRCAAFGEERTVPEWAELLGLSAPLIYERLKLGWSAEEALTAPVRPRGPNRPLPEMTRPRGSK